MSKVAIIRCEKNENSCPLTGCIRSLEGRQQGFQEYDTTQLAGVFTCHCPGDNVAALAKILKNKGAEAIHVCTCTFAMKNGSEWSLEEGGFCQRIDALLQAMHEASGLPCIKGTAHLPKGYAPQTTYYEKSESR